MYLFVYKNWKHRLTRWDHRKKNLSSTYGQFRLDFLRSGLKGNYTLYGCGEHPYQKILSAFNIDDHPLLGHIIEIKDPKLAVWLKLNFDQIFKDRTMEFSASYGPFDEFPIDERIKALNETYSKINNCSEQRRTIDSLTNSLRYYNQSSNMKVSMFDEISLRAGHLNEELKKQSSYLLSYEKKLRSNIDKMNSDLLISFSNKRLT